MTRRLFRNAGGWTAAVLFAGPLAGIGCAPASTSGGADAPATAPRRGAAPEPGRSGTLRQDEISVRMTVGDVRVELTPLAGWVLEAAAPDTRDRLTRIARTHASGLDRRAGEAEAVFFLVTFSGMRPAAEFQPEDLHLVSRGLRERPLAIRAITPGWGSQRLGRQESAVAVYAYPASVDLSRDLVVSYQGEEDSSWSSIVSAVEAERGRIPMAAQPSSRPYFLTLR